MCQNLEVFLDSLVFVFYFRGYFQGAEIIYWTEFSTSGYFVLFSSSGLTTHGPMTLNTPSRTLQVPPGETQINDIALNSSGSVLFSAAGNCVRLWDLRK